VLGGWVSLLVMHRHMTDYFLNVIPGRSLRESTAVFRLSRLDYRATECDQEQSH